MKPVSVRFQCFGPYMEQQLVDFEQLEKSGLFLICGETGSGKTTILDAICYALYGRSSGGLRGGLEVMRCALAGSDDDTFVEFIFDSNGRRYKFIRSLKYRTGKNKKSRNLNDYHNCLELEGDREIPLVEKEQDRFVSKKAEELIGLTYDQFRQVIILPQGQFERLLVSPSEEKETILVSLFHAQRWQRIAEELQRRVAEQDKTLKENRSAMEAKLRSHDCTSLAQLEEKTGAQRAALEQLLQETQEAEGCLQQAKVRKEAALLENQAFQELDRQEKQLLGLQAEEPRFTAEELLLEDANRAEVIRPVYAAWRQADAAAQRHRQTVRRAESALGEKEHELTRVRQQAAQLEARKPEMEAARQQILVLANAREAYSLIALREQELGEARLREGTAQQESQRAQSRFEMQAKAFEQALQTQNQAMQSYQNVQQQYLQGIGATLAKRLIQGEPCPVCGSTEHPAPAESGERHVTEAELDQALAHMNRANAQVSEALEGRTAAEQKKQAADRTLAEVQGHRKGAEAALREARAQQLPGIETEIQRSAAQHALESQLKRYDEAQRRIQGELTAALAGWEAGQKLLEAAKNDLDTAQLEARQQKDHWEQALEESGLGGEERYLAVSLAPEEKQRRQLQLHQFRAQLDTTCKAVQTKRKELEDRQRPDLLQLSGELAQAEKHHRSCVTTQTLAAKQLEDMVRDYHALEGELRQYEAARAKVDSDLVFARRLRGDSGISLQRYVLGVMLTSVTTEANRLLSSVYGGRYRLYRTDEIAGRSRKGGLELEVYDSHTSHRRSVTTLSGGEKFLVALSLAIGLSTVVQAQGAGVRLEAMFVDEGFGSLDREAVADALDVLQGMRRGSGIVGIISHVEQLAEVIPTRLEITKDRRGSRCTLRN